MSIKKLIIIFVVLALLSFEGYVLFDTVGGSMKNQKETEQYCKQKCNYDQGVVLWEFDGDGVSKGFTTREECFNYCSRVKNGFAYYLSEYSTAFISFFRFNHK